MALTLSGCAGLSASPKTALGFEVPASWSGMPDLPRNTDASLLEWWGRFNDPLLTGVIEQALRNNTNVIAAQAALQQARALRNVAAAALLPVLGSGASVQQSRTDKDSSNHFQIGLDASWELDFFGARRSAVAALDATAQASAASLGGVQISLAAEVALNYLTLRSAQERLAIARVNLDNQSETLQITRWRLQAGLVTDLESEQAFAAHEQTAALIPALQTTVLQMIHSLSLLTGQPPDALLAALTPATAVPQMAAALTPAFPAQTLLQRSDVRAAYYQVQAAAARLQQADAARLPGFNLGGSLGLAALTLGTLTDGASVVASLLASVSWPVFDGGAGQAQSDAQRAALQQAHASYKSSVLTALGEVEDALAALRGDQQRQARLENAFASADIAATLASQRYSSGLVDFQVVLETQRSRLGTQDSLATLRATVSADHVRLFKALGGGWDPGIGQPPALPPAPLTTPAS
ncbi:MAG: efflux transporter outer membrane subunit [Rhodoferax sp.]|nr:efflux transporter outer membrane subunit [Rhodoferax sp.]